MMERREFLFVSASMLLIPSALWPDSKLLRKNPLASFKLSWLDRLPWSNLININEVEGRTLEEKCQKAMVQLGVSGGVVYFPAGVYRFKESIKLKNNIIFRGEPPKDSLSPHADQYALGTRFEFPKYYHQLDKTPDITTAFKGIYLENPARDSNVGLLHLDINRGHIVFDDAGEKHQAGSNRFVVGCILRNAAVADPSIPERQKLKQHPWQRFTARHHAAIDIKVEQNLLVAQCRLPRSGDDNFSMDDYIILDPRNKLTTASKIVFDYDNRPGIYANHYSLGGAGGQGPDGTPESHPHAFRKGIIIQDNYIYNTGRMAIGFAGDGVLCQRNVIRFAENVLRPTATGLKLTTGSSTNDNRAVEMRGWRWQVLDNDYQVFRNIAAEGKYRINDGEGLMHEDHVNSTIKDCVLKNNKGNTYLSLYKTAGIDGLLIEGNIIRLGDGKQTIASGMAIYVNADRNSGEYACKNVSIRKNTVAGGGILIQGNPADHNEILENRCEGAPAAILNKAKAKMLNNKGFKAN